ncbi:Uncharacterised protein [Mycobacterium tuberculosis]|nr:Uncharacterised protein [Mycobacterium tuberculosis]
MYGGWLGLSGLYRSSSGSRLVGSDSSRMDASSHSVSVPCRLMCAASSMMPSAGIRSNCVRSGPSPVGLDVMVGCWACCW